MRHSGRSMRCDHYQLANKKKPRRGGRSGLWLVPIGGTGCGRGKGPQSTDSALHAIQFNFSVSLVNAP